MNFRLPQTRTIALGMVAIPALLVTKHALQTYLKLAQAPRRRIIEIDSIPDSLKDSVTRKTLANPRGHVSISDSRFMDIHGIGNAQSLSDETLLAAFVGGFFCGRVFAPERVLLGMAKLDFVNFSAIEKDSLPPPVWDSERLHGDRLPPLHTKLFGAFQVAHVELAEASPTAKTHQSSSSVDVVFGSDKTQFAGVHRFTIIREADKPDSVRVYHASMACNPTVNRRFQLETIFPLHKLHKLYAMWLFQEASVEVMRRIEAERC
ncbi:hypothetical protein B0I35DRAFT_436384 [Stachybotrys elegans]|uniref:Uncharacterized protein n=1 Tax=Stachybotrys elegans TaxID=80388 RepID=A0A8K0WQ27_9HYPO|nr:hypothetical protein B0I35DRAFT_436384 [Stachybotrys elegans]